METINHRWQMNLLCEVFTRAIGREDAYVGGNNALYYSALQAKRNDFKAPDVFVVLHTIDNPDRLSWVVWEEDGRTPNIVIELLSPSTESNDRGAKKRIYEQVLKVPDYFVYDPVDFRFEGWRLDRGAYRALVPDDEDRLFCEEIGLWLGRWRGTYIGRTSTYLRLFDAQGRVMPTFAEAAEEHARSVEERARGEAERARVEGERARIETERAEAEAERARAEAERADAEAERADAEAERADAEAERANAEAERARLAEARIRELMAELAKR